MFAVTPASFGARKLAHARMHADRYGQMRAQTDADIHARARSETCARAFALTLLARTHATADLRARARGQVLTDIN